MNVVADKKRQNHYNHGQKGIQPEKQDVEQKQDRHKYQKNGGFFIDFGFINFNASYNWHDIKKCQIQAYKKDNFRKTYMTGNDARNKLVRKYCKKEKSQKQKQQVSQKFIGDEQWIFTQFL